MAAVPAGLIAERRVVNKLMLANAVSPDTATSLDGLRWQQARRLQKLINAGVVNEVQPGRYYLDIPALAERVTARRQRAAIMLLVVVAIVALSAYFASKTIVRS
jgi:hypothetical protein